MLPNDKSKQKSPGAKSQEKAQLGGNISNTLAWQRHTFPTARGVH